MSETFGVFAPKAGIGISEPLQACNTQMCSCVVQFREAALTKIRAQVIRSQPCGPIGCCNEDHALTVSGCTRHRACGE